MNEQRSHTRSGPERCEHGAAMDDHCEACCSQCQEDIAAVAMCPRGQCPWSGCDCGHVTDEQQATQPEAPYGHAMLPNDSHPGPGCSCRECLRTYPEKP